MSYALLVAQLMGPLYLAIGIGMFVSSDHYKKMYDEVLKNPSMLYFGGLVAFVAGLLVLRVHAEWTSNWTVVITLIGWLALLKGVFLLIIPQQFVRWKKWVLSENGMLTSKLIVLILGVGLTYFGYFM